MPASQRWWLLLSGAEAFDNGLFAVECCMGCLFGTACRCVRSRCSEVVAVSGMKVLQVHEADGSVCSSALKIAVQCPMAWAVSYCRDRENAIKQGLGWKYLSVAALQSLAPKSEQYLGLAACHTFFVQHRSRVLRQPRCRSGLLKYQTGMKRRELRCRRVVDWGSCGK
jgi:hypothetical protein